jgi:hypothetical protein
MGRTTTYFDGLAIETKAFLAGQELLDILSLVTLQLDHLAHLSVIDDGAIASWDKLVSWPGEISNRLNIPNFFLMAFRIFFWSNLLGRP